MSKSILVTAAFFCFFNYDVTHAQLRVKEDVLSSHATHTKLGNKQNNDKLAKTKFDNKIGNNVGDKQSTHNNNQQRKLQEDYVAEPMDMVC